MRQSAAIVLTAALFLPPPVAADTQLPIIHVGDAAMNGSVIQPYDNVWLVTVHYRDGRIVERGLSTDHVRFLTQGGRRYLSRVEGEADVLAPPGKAAASSFSMTFNIFDPATMTPLHGEAFSSEGDAMFREFNGKQVTTRMRASKGAAETKTGVTTSEPVFDAHGGMTGLLLAALPLASGYEVQLPGMGDSDLDFTPIRVVGEEVVAAGRLGKVRAWKVEIGPRPAHSIYWISKQPPYVIRAVVNNPRGYASWDMIN